MSRRQPSDDWLDIRKRLERIEDKVTKSNELYLKIKHYIEGDRRRAVYVARHNRKDMHRLRVEKAALLNYIKELESFKKIDL